MVTQVLGFAGVAVLLVAIPGPAVTLVMKNAALHGGRHALRTAWGVFTADLVWAGASVLGLTALLVASAPAFIAVKLLGAAYLVYLGVRLIFWRERPDSATATADTGRSPLRRHAFREGFICDMANPKTVLVYASIIPQFVVPGQHSAVQIAVLGLTFAAIGFGSLSIYGAVFSSARSMLGRSAIKTWLMRSSGAVLASFGIGLAASAR